MDQVTKDHLTVPSAQRDDRLVGCIFVLERPKDCYVSKLTVDPKLQKLQLCQPAPIAIAGSQSSVRGGRCDRRGCMG
jgi:hypothetical protein